jgi:hypothetical protein
MKITLTWTNVEMKRNKSKATRKRDRKKHAQYIEQKKVTENNKETEITETNTNNIEDSSSEDDSDGTDSEMDTIQNIITPCRTPSQVNRQDENKSINTREKSSSPFRQIAHLCVGFNTFSLYIVMYFNWLYNFLYCITRDNFFTNLIVHYWYILCCIYRLIFVLSIRQFYTKIEIKTTDGHKDTLIGKLPRTQNLIVHIISQNITEIVGPSIREWKYFMKNVDEDFKDVEETDFMDDGVRIAIQKMEHFIEQRTLKNRK